MNTELSKMYDFYIVERTDKFDFRDCDQLTGRTQVIDERPVLVAAQEGAGKYNAVERNIVLRHEVEVLHLQVTVDLKLPWEFTTNSTASPHGFYHNRK